MTRLFFLAGESSGDLHGSHLIRALRNIEPDIHCDGLGGTRMQAEGMTLHYDLAGLGIMGFVEVIRSIGLIRKVFLDTVKRLKADPPDGLVLIDYPGFNIRLAKEAHKLGIPVIYYISPQIWAWKKGRIHTLARVVDKMLVILPFEKELYDAVALDCAYVGHPLLDHFATLDLKDAYKNDDLVVGIMPGSREMEIERNLEVMLGVAQGIREKYPNARFIAPCVDETRAQQVRTAAKDFPLEVAEGAAYEVLNAARFCLVASGTATLETALFEVPMLVMYKVSPISYWIARMVINIDAIAIVNILAGEHIVPEYIQGDATVDNMLPKALELIDETPARSAMIEALKDVRDTLDSGASENAAREIMEVLEHAHG